MNWMMASAIEPFRKAPSTAFSRLSHKRLEQAVFAAYRWHPDLNDQKMVEKLLKTTSGEELTKEASVFGIIKILKRLEVA